MNQGSKYLYETEIERIQSLMGVHVVNEQISIGNLLNPIGMRLPQTIKWMTTWDVHDWLTFVDITAGLLALIPSPASGVLLGVSTAACLGDGGLYLYEGDDYMGGLVLSFCLIPTGELALMSPRIARSIAKGKKQALDTIKKGRELAKKRTLTEAEKAIVKEADELMSELSKNAEKIAKLTQKNFVTKFITNVISKGGKSLFSTALLLSKMSWALGKPVLQLGGIYYTFDEVYLAMYGTDEQKMQLRYNSGFQKIVRLVKLLTNQEKIQEQIAEYVKMNEKVIQENPDRIAKVNYEKKGEVINQINEDTTNKLVAEEIKRKELIQSPSFTLVLSKKINPNTKKPYTIHEGQKGESVKKIQEMLEQLGFEKTLKGYDDTKISVDGDFGENTFSAVVVFQRQNNLNETGEINSETLELLIKNTQEINEK